MLYALCAVRCALCDYKKRVRQIKKWKGQLRYGMIDYQLKNKVKTRNELCRLSLPHGYERF
jgi:hypothetical protein